jgi:hypothetical protein
MFYRLKRMPVLAAARDWVTLGVYVLVAVLMMTSWIYLLGQMAVKAAVWLFS